MLKYLIIVLGLPFIIAGSNFNENGNYRLWYDEPAIEWEDALPVGNGRIGAMVFGKTDTERIQLNDDSMWPGSAEWSNPAGNKTDLQKIRNLLIQNKNKEADALLVEKFSRKGIGRSHQTLGDLFIELNQTNISNYSRELDLNDAVIHVRYKADNANINQNVFVSYPANAIIIQYKSDSPDGLSGKIRLSRPDDNGVPTVKITAAKNEIVMQGEVTQRDGWFDSQPTRILHGVKFEARLRASNVGGTVNSKDNYLELHNVNTLTLVIVSNTSFYTDDYTQKNTKELSAIAGKDFNTLFVEHKIDYQNLYNRVEFKLGNNGLDSLTTDTRLSRIKEGMTDLDLEAILFQYGRYLLISSSRPGTNPANLQGLWNEHILAPWNADYHMNINLQMNYWLADVTNLSELNAPLFDYVDRLIDRGKITARKNFGTRGAFIPHASDIWAPTFLRASTAYWGGSFGAAGWMMQHYFQHYRFTMDSAFLRERVYPALNEVVHFYFDWLITDPLDGYLVSAPSTSPENQFIKSNGDTVATCLGSAMDQQIIAEVFDNYLKTCQLLHIENSFVDSLKVARSKLRPGIVIGSDGRILEWDREYQEFEKGHRHMSHLYAFHPGNAVSKSTTPEYFEAARKTIEYRLANGGAHTGWSRAWLINLYARLQDGNEAQHHIQQLFVRSMYKNLFDSHPPFQIDGNFGYSAGVAEMLLQSQEQNVIHLLPALPSAWVNGYVKGLKARGNYLIDIQWSDNKLLEARIKSLSGGKTTLVYKNENIQLELAPGEIYTYH